jgi:hypothetical protein
MCQTPEKPGTSHKEGSLSCYVTLCTKACLENRRRRPISFNRLKNAKADLSTKEDSPKAQLRFSCQDVHSWWKACTQGAAS